MNTEAKINIPFGASLTSVATLPKDAERSSKDPYAEKSRAWMYITLFFVLVVLAGAIKLGYLNPWLEKIPVLDQLVTTPSASPSTNPSAEPKNNQRSIQSITSRALLARSVWALAVTSAFCVASRKTSASSRS